jgi:hypothetical protein
MQQTHFSRGQHGQRYGYGYDGYDEDRHASPQMMNGRGFRDFRGEEDEDRWVLFCMANKFIALRVQFLSTNATSICFYRARASSVSL